MDHKKGGGANRQVYIHLQNCSVKLHDNKRFFPVTINQGAGFGDSEVGRIRKPNLKKIYKQINMLISSVRKRYAYFFTLAQCLRKKRVQKNRKYSAGENNW